MKSYPDLLPNPVDVGDTSTAPPCTRCGEANLAPKAISMAFWRTRGLVVVDDVPALVCAGCGEEYIADDTAVALDYLRGAGFDIETANRVITVPVFRFASNCSR